MKGRGGERGYVKASRMGDVWGRQQWKGEKEE